MTGSSPTTIRQKTDQDGGDEHTDKDGHTQRHNVCGMVGPDTATAVTKPQAYSIRPGRNIASATNAPARRMPGSQLSFRMNTEKQKQGAVQGGARIRETPGSQNAGLAAALCETKASTQIGLYRQVRAVRM